MFVKLYYCKLASHQHFLYCFHVSVYKIIALAQKKYDFCMGASLIFYTCCYQLCLFSSQACYQTKWQCVLFFLNLVLFSFKNIMHVALKFTIGNDGKRHDFFYNEISHDVHSFCCRLQVCFLLCQINKTQIKKQEK